MGVSSGLVQGVRWGVIRRGTVWGLPRYDRCEGQTGRVLLTICVLMNVAECDTLLWGRKFT